MYNLLWTGFYSGARYFQQLLHFLIAFQATRVVLHSHRVLVLKFELLSLL